MVGLGMVFIGFSFWGLLLWWMNKLETAGLFHRVGLAMLILPFLANAAGWIVTEIGRQPWVVYGLLKTADGVSPLVGATSVWISMIGFTIVYGILATAGVYLTWRLGHPRAHENEDADKGQHAHAY